jgi:hypothetical protein
LKKRWPRPNHTSTGERFDSVGVERCRCALPSALAFDPGADIERGFPALCLWFSRNFGHQSAVSAGLDHADADLQDPPELIWDMLARLREGYDVAMRSVRRAPTHGSSGWATGPFYRLIALLSETRVPLDSGDFCVVSRRSGLAKICGGSVVVAEKSTSALAPANGMSWPSEPDDFTSRA